MHIISNISWNIQVTIFQNNEIMLLYCTKDVLTTEIIK